MQVAEEGRASSCDAGRQVREQGQDREHGKSILAVMLALTVTS